MENTNRYSCTREDVFKYAMTLLLIGALVVSFLLGRNAVSAAEAADGITAASRNAAPSSDEVAALQTQITNLTNQLAVSEALLAAKEDETASLCEAITAAEAKYAALDQEYDTLWDDYSRILSLYGTDYYLVYEIRRTSILPPCESIIRGTTIVSKEVYDTLSKGDVLPTVSEFLSIPSSMMGTEWTAFVYDLYPRNALDTGEIPA